MKKSDGSLTPRVSTPSQPCASPSSLLARRGSEEEPASPRFAKGVSSKRRVSSPQRGKASSNGSSIHLSFSGLREEDAITRSILNDISDHDLMYNSGHTEHRIGISLLPEEEVKREESHSENKLADLCKQLSTELKSTKEELSKLYRENRTLRERLSSQDEEIARLEHMYEAQNAVLFRELQDLRSALKPSTPREERSNVCCLPY